MLWGRKKTIYVKITTWEYFFFLTYFKYKYYGFIKNFVEKLYSRGISQNIIKAISVTDLPSEWQTENTSKVNMLKYSVFLIKFSVKAIFLSYQQRCYLWVQAKISTRLYQWLTDRVGDKLKTHQTSTYYEWLMDKHDRRMDLINLATDDLITLELLLDLIT